MRIDRLQHTSVPRPPGEEAHRRAMRFYHEILGLEPARKPHTFDGLIDVSWFRVGDQEIHVYAAGPDVSLRRTGAHFCLIVDDVDAARTQLEAAGVPCEDTTPIPNRPRFMTYDPFGNQIEIAAILGDYLAQ
jgi:catechol 2,3-dioxygenase-like lactoylglutathione lyase family enzyme